MLKAMICPRCVACSHTVAVMGAAGIGRFPPEPEGVTRPGTFTVGICGYTGWPCGGIGGCAIPIGGIGMAGTMATPCTVNQRRSSAKNAQSAKRTGSFNLDRSATAVNISCTPGPIYGYRSFYRQERRSKYHILWGMARRLEGAKWRLWQCGCGHWFR